MVNNQMSFQGLPSQGSDDPDWEEALDRSFRELEDGGAVGPKVALLFKLLDTDKRGTIEINEVLEQRRSILATMKLLHPNNQKDIETITTKANRSGTGRLDRAEFTAFISACQVINTQREEKAQSLRNDLTSVLQKVDFNSSSVHMGDIENPQHVMAGNEEQVVQVACQREK